MVISQSVEEETQQRILHRNFAVGRRRNAAENITWEEGEGGEYSGQSAGYI
jgi:hypothetical protein